MVQWEFPILKHQTFYKERDEETYDRQLTLLKKLLTAVFVLLGVFLRNGDRDVYNVRMEVLVYRVGIHTVISIAYTQNSHKGKRI